MTTHTYQMPARSQDATDRTRCLQVILHRDNGLMTTSQMMAILSEENLLEEAKLLPVTMYQVAIAKAPGAEASGIAPRLIEAYMRLEHPTLDGLSGQQFNDEVTIAIECIKEEGLEIAEQVAGSFGL